MATRSRCRHRLRTASIRRLARIISRGKTDNAQIYSKSWTDTKRKQKETGGSSSTDPVHAWRVRAPSVAVYLHAAVTSADDTSAHFFFSCNAYRSDPHTRVLPRGVNAKRTTNMHTYMRSHDVRLAYQTHRPIYKRRAKERWSEKENREKSETDEKRDEK